MKLQKATEEHNVREYNSKEHIRNLSKERDELLYITLERGNIVQVKGVRFLFHKYKPLSFTIKKFVHFHN